MSIAAPDYLPKPHAASIYPRQPRKQPEHHQAERAADFTRSVSADPMCQLGAKEHASCKRVGTDKHANPKRDGRPHASKGSSHADNKQLKANSYEIRTRAECKMFSFNSNGFQFVPATPRNMSAT